MVLFFWVLLVHSIAQTDQSFVLSPLAFYLPKIILCFGVWVYLVCVGVLSQENTRNIPTPLRISGIIVYSLYFIYLATISNYVFKLVKDMKKAYKILV